MVPVGTSSWFPKIPANQVDTLQSTLQCNTVPIMYRNVGECMQETPIELFSG